MDANSIGKSGRTGESNALSPKKAVNLSRNQIDGRKIKSTDSPRDSVNVLLSPESKELAEARTKAYELAVRSPDIREDRVAELQEKIKSGRYQVDSANIADGILREAIRDKLSGMPE